MDRIKKTARSALFALAMLGMPFLLKADSYSKFWVSVTKYTASATSVLVEKDKPATYYRPENVMDGNNNTAWCEGKPGAGIGEVLKVRFTKKYIANAIDILNGYGRNKNLYFMNNRVKSYKLTLYKMEYGRRRKEVVIGALTDDGCDQYEDGPFRKSEINERMAKRYCKDYRPGRPLSEDCIRRIMNVCWYPDKKPLTWGRIALKDSRDEGDMDRYQCFTGFDLEIRGVYRGKTNDTCIAEISLRGGVNSPAYDPLVEIRKSEAQIRKKWPGEGLHGEDELIKLKRKLKGCY